MKPLSPSETSERICEAVPIFDAEQLTQGQQIAHIKLSDQLYTLRITRAGKLILTK